MQQHGRIERMPAAIRDAPRRSRLDRRSAPIYLSPAVTDEFDIEPFEPDLTGIVRFLCDEREFSRDRVAAAIERTFRELVAWVCSTTDIRRRLSYRLRVCINTPLNVSTEEVRVKEKMLAAAIAIASVSAYGVVPRAQTPAQAPSPVPPPAAKIQPGDAPGYAFDITKAEIDYVLKNAPPNPPDRQLRVVDMGKYNLGVGIVRRGPTNEKPGRSCPLCSGTTTRPRFTTSPPELAS